MCAHNYHGKVDHILNTAAKCNDKPKNKRTQYWQVRKPTDLLTSASLHSGVWGRGHFGAAGYAQPLRYRKPVREGRWCFQVVSCPFCQSTSGYRSHPLKHCNVELAGHFKRGKNLLPSKPQRGQGRKHFFSPTSVLQCVKLPIAFHAQFKMLVMTYSIKPYMV